MGDGTHLGESISEYNNTNRSNRKGVGAEAGKDAAGPWLFWVSWACMGLHRPFYLSVMEILGASFFSNLKAIVAVLIVLCVLIKVLKD